jgi:hypothetical protein
VASQRQAANSILYRLTRFSVTSCAINCRDGAGLLWLPDHCGLASIHHYHSIHHIPQYAIILYSTILIEMVHVLGCKNRSNKEECKGLKFYTLPFRNEELLKTWLALICRRRNEVTIHSRVCSAAHFAGGIKKSDSLPQTFPWQKCIPT